MNAAAVPIQKTNDTVEPQFVRFDVWRIIIEMTVDLSGNLI